MEDPVRILVTNDDGVGAPGIAALARAAVSTGHDVVVVAPMTNYSGAGAAVGPVHSRGGVDYTRYVVGELTELPAFGIDGPPALAVILACVGGFGSRPDLVLSGINDGANVGRSALHSGTIGAALTAAHFGLRALAISIRFGSQPVPWETPATLAAALVPILAETEPATVWNLNVPDVPLSELRGIRYGHLGTSGTIRSAIDDPNTTWSDRKPAGQNGASTDTDRLVGPTPAHDRVVLTSMEGGTLRLDLVSPARQASTDALATDADLVANGFASLTALVGVREAGEPAAAATVRAAASVESTIENTPERGPRRPR